MTTRTCYSWDRDGYYVGSTEAHPDPQVPGRWLLPAFATFSAPPSAPGKIARFVSSAWALVDAPAASADNNGIPPDVLAARARQANIENARAAATATSRLVDEAQATGQRVHLNWMEYVHQLITIAETPNGRSPDDLPTPPSIPLIVPPDPPVPPVYPVSEE